MMQQLVHTIWSAIEKHYDLNVASGELELVQKFEKIAASDFTSVSHLFRQIKAARDQVNRDSVDVLEIGLILQQLMLINVLAVPPGQLWGMGVSFTKNDSTLDKVESKLNAIFGNKTKAQITALGNGVPANHVEVKAAKSSQATGTALGKRKARTDPERDMHYNLSDRSRCYCGGAHNDISGGPRFKTNCANRQNDQQWKVKRRGIWSRARSDDQAQVDHAPTPKVKGKGKGKLKAKGRERNVVPTEARLPTNVSVDACNAEQSLTVDPPVSPALLSPPPPPAEWNFR
ncbi:hypothetical protein F441_11572 [Phytophthora nicotianae CJ01A1]|uniref:Uncharacterized protein n=2 Tax=Phytophthora nicotianae TaxID=4792 RepID=W2IRZ6_PHYNI|nr:hypothetical protein L915_11332 [Phytophthora nicotianae]ETL36861.1 hypothetical protein L916_11234 [Phytophthora nicotianae]ETP13165.1 hypothetical protein F441_11572 [Phytophthora nicotianae CJ01A1]